MEFRQKIPFLILVLILNNTYSYGLPNPVFENASEEMTASGYVKLSWQWNYPEANKEGYEFEVQQSANANFEPARTIYKGPDHATFLSGLRNGIYYHRIRVISPGGEEQSPWSAPILIRVKHHSLQLAFALFGIGAIVFLITVGIVVQGSRSASNNS